MNNKKGKPFSETEREQEKKGEELSLVEEKAFENIIKYSEERNTLGEKDKQVVKSDRDSKGRLLPGHSMGRPKGRKDRLPRQTINDVMKVYDELGGTKGFVEWAKTNKTIFYRFIYSRLIPKDVDVHISHDVNMAVSMLREARTLLTTGDVIEVEALPEFNQEGLIVDRHSPIALPDAIAQPEDSTSPEGLEDQEGQEDSTI